MKSSKWIILIAIYSIIVGCSDHNNKNSIAVVDGSPITRAEFEGYLKNRGINTNNPEMLREAKESYVRARALVIAIEKQGIPESGEIDRKVMEFRNQLVTATYFSKVLDKGLREEKLKNEYNKNLAKYTNRSVKLAHILIKVTKDDPKEEYKKLTEANNIYRRLKKGESFESLVKKYSEDNTTKYKSGVIGVIREGMVNREFFNQAFSLKAGEVSKPTRGQLGFHILKSLSGPITVTPQYAQIKERIRFEMKQKNRVEEAKRLLSTVKIKEYNESDKKVAR